MVLDPIPQSLPVHFFGSRPQPHTSPQDVVRVHLEKNCIFTECFADLIIHRICRLHCRSSASNCNTLQHTASCCNRLQHAATQLLSGTYLDSELNTLSSLQHTATHCNTLQHTASQCTRDLILYRAYNTLQRTATHCNTLQHNVQET